MQHPLKVHVSPLSPEDYNVAHRVYRDICDWGHNASIEVDASSDIHLIVSYEDTTGIQIHYNGRTVKTLKELRLLLHSMRLPHAIPGTIR